MDCFLQDREYEILLSHAISFRKGVGCNAMRVGGSVFIVGNVKPAILFITKFNQILNPLRYRLPIFGRVSQFTMSQITKKGKSSHRSFRIIPPRPVCILILIQPVQCLNHRSFNPIRILHSSPGKSCHPTHFVASPAH